MGAARKGQGRLLKASEAARALGISLDTLRRWDRDGRIRVVRDASNRRVVPESEVERLSGRGPGVRTGVALSARNRLPGVVRRSEEHTSELQSQSNLVCRLLLEKKKQQPS